MNLLDGLNLGWRKKLPLILQTEAAECGLASLAMIASYYGAHTDLAQLRRRFGLSLKGATLQDLVRIADQVGFASRPVRLELDELHMLETPCLLHWDLNHFVVLKRVNRGSIVIHDPAVGVCRLPLSEVSKHFTGVAMELSLTGGFEPAVEAPRVRMRALLGRLVGISSSLGQLFALALAIEVFAVVSPFFMQWIVDDALVTADHDLLLTLTIGFALLLLIRVSVTAMRGWLLIALGASLKVQGRTNLFSHLINLPASYFEARHLGDVMSRFGSQETILQAITTDLVEALLDGLLASITLLVMFVFSPSLAALVFAGAVLYALFRWASYTPLRQASAEAIVWGARRDSHFLETLRGIKTIKLFNGQDERRSHWLNLLVQTINRQLTTQKLHLLVRTANSLLLGLLGILIIWLGALRVLENTFSVGMLFAFISYKDQFLDRVSSLINKVLDLQLLRLHAERLADIALTAPEPRGQPMDIQSTTFVPSSLEVRALRFRYSDNDPWVLDGLDFRIEAGESVAIAGASGCGKTTLLKLLASLLTPTEGEVLVDGKPLTRLGIERYRSMIGVVMQDDQLFAGSIADNISFFAAVPDLQRVEECAQLAAVHDDIIAMAMGYSTLIGDMGTVLSGGQKQRVLLARALYRQPVILLLDEATSHLDVDREKEVNAAVRARQITRVIVAHRPETIRSADRVLMLDQGKIVSDSKRGMNLQIAGPPDEKRLFRYANLPLQTPAEARPPKQVPIDVRSPIDLPTVGMIPDFSHDELRAAGFAPLQQEARAVRRVFPREVLFLHQPHVVSAVYQNLLATVAETRSSGALRSLLFTSTTTGEGKTLTAVNTAIALTKMGARVLLIDADLYHPACHTTLTMPPGSGLGELLSGQAELSELLRPTPIERLVFLGAGSSSAAPAEALGATSMKAAFPFLHKMYDYLVIDSPSVDAANDALLLATMVEGVMLIMDSQHTPHQRVQNTWRRLAQVNSPLLGVVLNKVATRSQEETPPEPHSEATTVSHGPRKAIGKRKETEILEPMTANLRR